VQYSFKMENFNLPKVILSESLLAVKHGYSISPFIKLIIMKNNIQGFEIS